MHSFYVFSLHKALMKYILIYYKSRDLKLLCDINIVTINFLLNIIFVQNSSL